MQAEERNGVKNMLIVATALCIVCSLIVSSAAMILKPMQDGNVEVDKKRNLLSVVGFEADDIASSNDVRTLFEENFTATLINMETGAEATEEDVKALRFTSMEEALTKYDWYKESKRKKDETSTKLGKSDDIAGIKAREKFTIVYKLQKSGGPVEKYVFPVRGYGLWSMVQGFLAVEPDFQTVAGITFYEQKETPGLGGECVTAKFRDPWVGKKIYKNPDDVLKDRNVGLTVMKGAGVGEYQLDGMTGATITSNGITNMIHYWMGPGGFGPYINLQKGGSVESSASTTPVSTSAPEGEKKPEGEGH